MFVLLDMVWLGVVCFVITYCVVLRCIGFDAGLLVGTCTAVGGLFVLVLFCGLGLLHCLGRICRFFGFLILGFGVI